jgi:PAS domain S-box-containing protein
VIIAPVPHSEGARLRALQQLEILDTEAEDGFDAIVKAAALVCGTPISLVSLVDTDRQWFKASVGLGGATQTPRDGSFCSHAILEDGFFEVPNALEDERFHDNPMVIGAPYIRLYAGAPLILACGAYVGELCVIDSEARALNPHQKQVLLHLAKAASQFMETRRMALKAEQTAAQFQVLSESSPLGIYATDPAGACTYTNTVWQHIFGMTEAQSLGMGWTTTMHPEDAPNVFARWQACADSGQAFDMEFRIHQPGGALRVVHSTARQTLDGQGLRTGYVGSVQDMTEQSKAKHATQSLLGMIKTHFVVSFTDLSGRIIEVNDDYCKLSGYARADLLGQDHRIVSSGIHPKPFFADMWQKLKVGESWQGEICNRKSTGEPYWQYSIVAPLRGADGTIEQYVMLSRDISQRKQFEDQLRKSQLFLDRTGRMAGVGGWEVDLRANSVYWSDETCRIQGVEPGYTPTIEEGIQFYAPDSRPIIQAAVDSAISTGAGWDLELELVRKDGKYVWVRAIGSAEFEEGVPVRLNGAFQDITERKRVMDELAHTNVEMRNFAYVASHDLKSPLRGIDQLAGWIAEEIEGQASATSVEYLRLMRVRIARLENLLNDLLAYSQAGRVEGTPEMLDFGELVLGVFDLCRGNKPVTLKVEGDLPTFLTTRTPLELVFRNLMNNAIKHHDSAQGVLTVAVRRLQDRYEFSVADDGAGIAPEHFERIFGMFQTLRPRDEVEGSGMGLAIVKKTVELFGGTIQVAANAPRGAVFRFSWPVNVVKRA